MTLWSLSIATHRHVAHATQFSGRKALCWLCPGKCRRLGTQDMATSSDLCALLLFFFFHEGNLVWRTGSFRFLCCSDVRLRPWRLQTLWQRRPGRQKVRSSNLSCSIVKQRTWYMPSCNTMSERLFHGVASGSNCRTLARTRLGIDGCWRREGRWWTTSRLRRAQTPMCYGGSGPPIYTPK